METCKQRMSKGRLGYDSESGAQIIDVTKVRTLELPSASPHSSAFHAATLVATRLQQEEKNY